MSQSERELLATVKFGVDRASVQGVKRGAAEMEAAIKRIDDRMNKLNESGEKLAQIGIRVGALGLVISGPFILAARTFVDEMGEADKVSREWLKSTEEIRKSQLRIGRIATQNLLPILEKAADLAEKTADFAEKHPGAITAAVTIGASLTALGGLATSIGVLAGSIGLLGRLLGGRTLLGLGGAAAGAGAATGVGGAAAGAAGGAGLAGLAAILTPILGVAGGFGINEMLARSGRFGETFQPFSRIGAVGAFGLANIFTDRERALQIGGQVGRFLGAPELQEREAVAFTGRPGRMPPGLAQMRAIQSALTEIRREALAELRPLEKDAADERVQIADDFAIDSIAAEERGARQRTAIIEDFAHQQSQALADFDRMRGRQIRDFRANEASILAQHNETRIAQAADFGRETLEMEEDFQRQRQEAAEDLEVTVDNLARSRDALGIVKARREAARQEAREQVRFNVEAGRRNEDFARQQNETEVNFAASREQRLDAFELRQRDQQQDWDIRRAREKAAQEERLQKLDDDLEEENQKLTEHRVRALIDLELGLTNERTALLGSYRKRFSDQVGYQAGAEAAWGRFLGNIQRAIPRGVPQFATGGLTGAGGLALLHPNEFVLSAATTRAAQRIAGGVLDQEKMLAAMSGRGGRTGMHLTQDFSFIGALSAEERANFRRVARVEAQNAIREMLN